MNQHTFFDNPDFREYVRLLAELHQLIRDGTDETPRGEALRDRMDGPGDRLSPDEIVAANAISADFYSLTASPTNLISPQTEQVHADLRAAFEARDQKDFNRALELARRCAGHVEPSKLASMRGSIWMAAGEDLIAGRFYRRAAELDPTNANYPCLALHCLAKTDAEDARRQAAQILEAPEDHSIQAVLKAADLLSSSALVQPDGGGQSDLESLVPILEQTIFRLQTSGEGDGQPSLVEMAFTIMGLCYERLDLTEQARNYYDRGLSRFPTSVPLLTARGVLLYGSETEKSVRDFEAAVREGSRSVWPYFHLAHHALLNNQFDKCIEFCDRALRFSPPEEAQANLLEWMAISQASLGYPAPMVEAGFLAAQQLAPDNERMKRNLAAFNRQAPPSDVGWEKGTEQELQPFKRRMSPALNALTAA